jgi:hypothetical protein
MLNTIKKILDFDISDDKKLDLIKALLKEPLVISGYHSTLPGTIANVPYQGTGGGINTGHYTNGTVELCSKQ